MIMTSNTMRNRIIERMKDKGMKIADLARVSGVQDPTIRKFLDGKHRTIGFDKAEAIAEALGITVAELSSESTPEQSNVKTITSIPNAAKIPIIGSAGTSFASGKIIIENQPIGATFCPPALTRARDIYAFYISGNSMMPEHKDGEIRFASPHIPCRIGDTAAIHEKGEDGKVYLNVGHLVEANEENIIIAKIHPTNTNIEIPRNRIKSVDRILTQNDLFGL